jgi:predicted heme/steroid binding protein
MRTSATLTLSSATHFTIQQDSQTFVGTSNAVEDVSSTGIWIDFTHGSGATAGRGATFYGNTTSARFQLSAEL